MFDKSHKTFAQYAINNCAHKLAHYSNKMYFCTPFAKIERSWNALHIIAFLFRA